MPQKKNPDSLELIRGKSGRVFGDLTSLFVTMKGLPMTYNRDMQEDKEPLFDAAAQLSGSLEMMQVVIESTWLHPGKPADAAEESWVVATDLAEALARAGTPFHRAHQLVGKLVLESIQQGKKPPIGRPQELTAFAPEFTPEMAALLHPSEGMKTREIPGGTGPATVARALDEAEARLARSIWQAMNKTFRQGQILKLIRAKRILTQEDLARELKSSYGIDTTQVTLSRDIRELGSAEDAGGLPPGGASAAGPDLATVAAEFLQDVRAAQNLVVLRTSPGNANALAVALDKEDWPEIVGTSRVTTPY